MRGALILIIIIILFLILLARLLDFFAIATAGTRRCSIFLSLLVVGTSFF
jgi:hypothetical protein